MASRTTQDAAARASDGGPMSASTGGMETKSDAVQVAVRVRPLSASEASQGSEACVDVAGASVLLAEKQFAFDAALPSSMLQESVYSGLVAPMIGEFFDGYNATVLAYGQTGSGKTYTMGNEFALNDAPGERGVIPRVIADVFERVHASAQQFVVKLSYLEILNEEIHDLLMDKFSSKTPLSASTGLSVRGDGDRGIVVNGLSEHIVASADQACNLLRSGALVRATASTSMNAQSSRSHAICTIFMEQHEVTVAEGTETRHSKFHLVDLAGSERVRRTKSEGARFKEGVNINRGLLALGNVINALCERSRSSTLTAHIPYRDSKLTRLLQDSLGGNSKTLMIACISPADINYEETSNTLRYASRTRKIENQAVVNKERSAEREVAYLKQQLEIVQLQILHQTRGRSNGPVRINAQNASEDDGKKASLLIVSCVEDENRMLKEELRQANSAKDKWKSIAGDLADRSKMMRAESKLAATKATPGKMPTPTIKTAAGQTEKAEQRSKSGRLSRLEKLRKFQTQRVKSLHAKEGAGLKRKTTEDASSTNKRNRTSMMPSPTAPSIERSSLKATRVSMLPTPVRDSVVESGSHAMAAFTKLLQQVVASHDAIYGAKEAVRVNVAHRKALSLEISQLGTLPSVGNSEKLVKLQNELRNKTDNIRRLQQKLASVEKTISLPSGLFPANVDTCHDLIRYIIEWMMETREELLTFTNCCNDLDAANRVMKAQKEGDHKKTRELEAKLEEVVGELRDQATTKKIAKKRRARESYEAIETLFSSSDEEEDNAEVDSDYVDEEDRRKRGTSTPVSKGSNKVDVMDEIDELLESSTATCCSCHGKCATKACACKSQRRVCTAECSCNASKCRNGKSGESDTSGAVGNSAVASIPKSVGATVLTCSVHGPSTPKRGTSSTDASTTEKQTTTAPGATTSAVIDLMYP